MRAQQVPASHGGAPPIGMPHPSSGALGAGGSSGGPLGLVNVPGAQHPLSILNKQDLHRPEESKSNSGMSGVPDDRHRSSISPQEREKYRPRSPSEQHELKKIKKEEKDMGHVRSYSWKNFDIFFFTPFCLLYSNRMVKNQTKT